MEANITLGYHLLPSIPIPHHSKHEAAQAQGDHGEIGAVWKHGACLERQNP